MPPFCSKTCNIYRWKFLQYWTYMKYASLSVWIDLFFFPCNFVFASVTVSPIHIWTSARPHPNSSYTNIIHLMYQNDEDQNGNPCTYPSCDTDANKPNFDYDFSCAELVLQVYLVPNKVTTMFVWHCQSSLRSTNKKCSSSLIFVVFLIWRCHEWLSYLNNCS